jgi:hypothetical protein
MTPLTARTRQVLVHKRWLAPAADFWPVPSELQELALRDPASQHVIASPFVFRQVARP